MIDWHRWETANINVSKDSGIEITESIVTKQPALKKEVLGCKLN